MKVTSNFSSTEVLNLRQAYSRFILFAAITLLTLAPTAVAQTIPASVAALPEADVLIYVSPQRILNEAAPRVVPAAEITKMRTVFDDLKKSVGIEPSTIEYLVIALRFHKPASDLSFVAPDVMAVVGGDFSSDSLMTMGQLYLQEKARVEKYGSKSMVVMKGDSIAFDTAKNPILKPYAEIGMVPLSANSFAIGNLPYVKSAIDASDGTGRISSAALESLMRDPNALIAASGAPLATLAKSLGLFGLENTARESRCDTSFGNFYAAVTMEANNFRLRGAMNADNPNTAKIIYNLFSGLMQQGINTVPDEKAQSILQSLKMTVRESEIVWEADVPNKVVADYLKPKPATTTTPTTTKPATRPPARRKRTR